MTNTKLLAFHGDPAIKAKYVARLQMHHAQDQIVQGFYAEGDPEKAEFRGCAIGCVLHSDNHSAYPDEIGYPTVLAHLEDSIFEGLPASEAPQFAVDFLAVVEPGADLSLVWPRFALWMLSDPKHGVLRLANEGTRPSIEGIIALCQREVAGESVSEEDWRSASANADSFAAAAAAAHVSAHAAAAAAHVSVHAHAHVSASSAADYAADAYEIYVGASGAGARARQRQAAKLLELLKSAPVETP